MRRSQLEHLIRASTAILGERAVIVIGSQSILGSVEEAQLPSEAVASVEADLVPLDDLDEAKSTLLDGSIGELSPFHETFGIYALGVGERTARLPSGWRNRLVALTSPNTGGGTGWCLDRHDLYVAKIVAGREKDLRFCQALLRAGIVDDHTVLERLVLTELSGAELEAARQRIVAQVAGVERD